MEADSPKARVDAHSELKRFLSHTGLEQEDPIKRIAWIKNTSPEKILDLLSVINGQIRGAKEFQRWAGVGVKSTVSLGGNPEFAEMEPPEHAERELTQVIFKMQEEINETNFPTQIAKLYTGIIFSHIFADGNGRTARSVYGLLRHGKLPESTHFAKRSGKIMEIANTLNSAAMALLFHKENVVETTDGAYQNYNLLTEGICVDTQMNYLKYLAARRATHQTRGAAPESIEFTTLSEQQRADFTLEYERLRKEYFWTVQEVIEKYSKHIIPMIDEAIPIKE